MQQYPNCDNLMLRCPQTDVFTFTRNQESEIINTINGSATFSSKGVFAVNYPISYDIILNTNNTISVKEIYFSFITDKESDFEHIPNFLPDRFFKTLQSQHRLIKIPSISENAFQIKKDNMKFSTPSDIKIVIFVINEYGDANMIHKSDIVFTVESQEVKVQDVANQEARVGNKMTLGLTWLGIGLLPMFLGADLLARVRLEH